MSVSSQRGTAIVGTSPALLRTLMRARRAALSSCDVLITGETGTGKELLARFVHDNSPRGARPFVAINCAGIPAGVFESELFGHERGAFTGAVNQHLGAFEQANGGTLFLDEIGDLALDLQAKLLRVIQEREVRRVGGTQPRRVDLRLVTGTHRDLGGAGFRNDLYHRIAGYVLELPALRNRGRDVVLIAADFLKRSEFTGKRLSRDAERLLVTCEWPGNIRQLQNVIRGSAIDADGDVIAAEDLRHQLGPAGPPDGSEVVLALLKRSGRLNCGQLTNALDVDRSTAFRMLQRLEKHGQIARRGAGRAAYYVSVDRRGP